MDITSTSPVDDNRPFRQTYDNPRRFFIVTIAGIFIAEVVAMIVIYFLSPGAFWLETMLDASIMTVLIFPIVYYFSFRPLLRQVTERERSEALLAKVLDNLPVGVWIIDAHGQITHGNLATKQIWAGAKYVGIDQYGEYKGWRLDSGELIKPDEWAAARAIQHAETSLNEEIEIECFDGTHKIILNSAVPIVEEGVVQGVIVVNQNITERKQSEKALEKSEALYKTAFEILPVGAWIADSQGNIIYGNPAGQQLWAGARYVGIEQYGEYKGWWLSTGKPIEPEDWAVARAVRNGETSLNEEIEIECFDGTHKIILNTAIPFRDARQQILGVFVVNYDITERKRYEQELIQSNELIQSAFNSVDTLIAYMDRNFNFIRVNETYSQSGGHPADYFIGKNHFDLYPNAENQAIFQQVVDTGEPFSIFEKPFEYPEFPERGVTYWNWSLQPVKDGGGTVQGLVLSLLEVTERKRAQLLVEQRSQELLSINQALIAEIEERKQIESQLVIQTRAVELERQRFNDVLEILPAYLILLTPDYHVEFANHYFRERFGEDQGRRCYEYLFGRSEPCENCETYTVLKSGKSHNWEWTGPDGRNYDVHDFPFKDMDGSILILEMGIDITTRKQAEEKLRSLNAYNRSLLEANLDALVTITPDGKIGDVNAVSEAITGFTRDELIGTDFHSYFTDPEKARAGYQQVFETGLVRDYELEIQHKDGHTKPVIYNASIYRDEVGQVTGVFAAARDITERKQTEMLLERQNQDLRELTIIEQKQRELAEGLAQSIAALSSSLDLEHVLDTILEQLRRSVPFTIAAITEIENGTVRVVRYTSLDNHPDAARALEFKHLLINYPLQEVSASQQPIYIEDIANYSAWSHVPGVEWIRSYIASPVVAGGQFIGTIHLISDQPCAFSQETVSLLKAFSAPAALAVENARLFTAELHARQVAETLSAISLALTQTLNFNTDLKVLLEYLCQLIPYDRAYITVTESENQWTVRAINGFESHIDFNSELNTVVDEWDFSPIQKVIASQKSLLIADTQLVPDLPDFPALKAFRNWLAIPMLASGKVIGIVAMAKITPGFFNHEHVRLAEVVVGQASIALQNSWLFEQVRAGHERLQSLSRRLVEVQENERRYVARELHDEAGQALTAIKFGLGLLEQEAQHPENIFAQVAELQRISDGVLENLHRLAMDLRPASLDYLGLVAALEQLVKDMVKRYNLNVRFKAAGYSETERLPDHVETTLYRIVQEALTNAIRHARANNVDVILELRDGRALAIVEDDGIGLDISQIEKSGHLGLLGMQERAQMMGGSLQIESNPGSGTTVAVEVPYANSNLDR